MRFSYEHSLKIEIACNSSFERPPGTSWCVKPGLVDRERVCHAIMSLLEYCFKIATARVSSELEPGEALIMDEFCGGKKAVGALADERKDGLWTESTPCGCR